jgi:hypothetical protein
MSLRSFNKPAKRPAGTGEGTAPALIGTALDEEEAYRVGRRISKRLLAERKDLRRSKSPRFNPTMPKLNLPD